MSVAGVARKHKAGGPFLSSNFCADGRRLQHLRLSTSLVDSSLNYLPTQAPAAEPLGGRAEVTNSFSTDICLEPPSDYQTFLSQMKLVQ